MITTVEKTSSKKTASLFRVLGQPARVRLLLAIGESEACVCHLEAALGQRQAYISQQLMALREAGLVTSRRDGRNMYYRLEDPQLLELLQKAGTMVGIPPAEMPYSPAAKVLHNCPCPHCTGENADCSKELG
jgi:DNA-binding transcriptional ArsR family regulator